ncbi:IS1595 family transposase [Polaromonas sp.]|uniref:IS1595 family transposase n=1 Tax=Polaromonas sp. TaxID=1869339 RepID=UPI0035662303
MAEPILNQPHFQNQDAARAYLEALRWSNGVVCPHCGVIGGHYELKGTSTRPGLYKCGACSDQFTVTVGTVFERSKIKLHIWLQAVHLMSASKKGVSAKQIERMLGVSYKTAWFMCHRIREAMTPDHTATGPMGGPDTIVEADETYWGNLYKGSRGPAHKMKVVSLVERESGQKRSFHVANVTSETVGAILKSQVHADTHLMTDESVVYKRIGKDFDAHSTVNHSRKEYARGNVTSNTVEASFAIFKRGLNGTFHSVSERHLQRYANEFDFRWNFRLGNGFTDSDRADAALKGIAGKRLTYRRINGQQEANA